MLFHIAFTNPPSASALNNIIAWTLAKLNSDFNGLCPEQAQYDNVFAGQPDLQATYMDYKSRIGCTSVQFVSTSPAYVLSPKALPTLSGGSIAALDSRIKDADPAVNPERVLNVWVASLGGGLLGYAQFPWESPAKYDGVVITREVFGASGPYPEYRQNKTLSHEVGHWLGLYHVFQDTFRYEGGNVDYAPGNNAQELKGDCVIDTPPQGEPVFGNPFTTSPPLWPVTIRPADETQSYKCMFMNFMDYTDDPARFMFTRDQATKMRLMTTMYRPLLGTPPPAFKPAPAPAPTLALDLTFATADALKAWTRTGIVVYANGGATLRGTARMSRTFSFVGKYTLVVTYASTSTTALLQIVRGGAKLAGASLSVVAANKAVSFTSTGTFTLLFTNANTKDVRITRITLENRAP